MKRHLRIVSNWFGVGLVALLIFVFSPVKTTYSHAETAGACNINCDIEPSKSYLLRGCEEMKARSAFPDQWTCSNAAIFETGSRPKRIHDLRMKSYASLTADEKAILVAADKVGNLRMCGKPVGNALLIKYRGKPAVVTTAHGIVVHKTLTSKCEGHKKPAVFYYPNTSYFDPNDPHKNKGFFLKKVDLVYPPEKLEEAVTALADPLDRNINGDYVVFFLKKDITKDTMPNGNKRSYLKFAKNSYYEGSDLYSLGVGLDPDEYALAIVYQTRCNYHRREKLVNHDCVSVPGSSGSLLGTLEDGEIAFSGMNRGARFGELNMPGPSSDYKSFWNVGVDSFYIQGRQ